jgi:hypothetical protein
MPSIGRRLVQKLRYAVIVTSETIHVAPVLKPPLSLGKASARAWYRNVKISVSLTFRRVSV